LWPAIETTSSTKKFLLLFRSFSYFSPPFSC
jgi:hypothetical protein